jgi:predicted RNase H-like HicB family nuclease
MSTLTAVVEKACNTNLDVGNVSGLPGAHSQREMLDESQSNFSEVMTMLLEDE